MTLHHATTEELCQLMAAAERGRSPTAPSTLVLRGVGLLALRCAQADGDPQVVGDASAALPAAVASLDDVLTRACAQERTLLFARQRLTPMHHREGIRAMLAERIESYAFEHPEFVVPFVDSVQSALAIGGESTRKAVDALMLPEPGPDGCTEVEYGSAAPLTDERETTITVDCPACSAVHKYHATVVGEWWSKPAPAPEPIVRSFPCPATGARFVATVAVDLPARFNGSPRVIRGEVTVTSRAGA